MAGDLAGTADNPSVPGLATKADRGHTHPIAEVTGLSAAIDGKVDKRTAGADVVYGFGGPESGGAYRVSSTYAGDRIVQRDSFGNVDLPFAPHGPGNATSKKYVDSRPALFSGAGTAPSTIAGAVVGDWWLNTTTMELSKITGV